LDENVTAVEHITAGTVKAVKVIIDGTMLIQEGGKFYNVLGAQVK
jgi:hypothetical protein